MLGQIVGCVILIVVFLGLPFLPGRVAVKEFNVPQFVASIGFGLCTLSFTVAMIIMATTRDLPTGSAIAVFVGVMAGAILIAFVSPIMVLVEHVRNVLVVARFGGPRYRWLLPTWTAVTITMATTIALTAAGLTAVVLWFQSLERVERQIDAGGPEAPPVSAAFNAEAERLILAALLIGTIGCTVMVIAGIIVGLVQRHRRTVRDDAYTQERQEWETELIESVRRGYIDELASIKLKWGPVSHTVDALQRRFFPEESAEQWGPTFGSPNEHAV